MTIYLEYAIADNYFMDWLILFFAAITLKIPFKKWRLALAAALGTAIALVSVYLQGVWLFAVKALCLFAMCLCAIGFGKKLFWFVLLTFAYTFVLGGAVVGFFHLFNVQHIADGTLLYTASPPVFVWLAAIAFVSFGVYSLLHLFKQQKAVQPHLKKVEVTLCNGKKHAVLGFCDSGNSVTCDYLPVCFVTKQFGNFSALLAQQILCGKSKVVQVTTLTGQAATHAMAAQITADGVTRNVLLALPPQKCHTPYQLLLSSQFCQSG